MTDQTEKRETEATAPLVARSEYREAVRRHKDATGLPMRVITERALSIGLPAIGVKNVPIAR